MSLDAVVVGKRDAYSLKSKPRNINPLSVVGAAKFWREMGRSRRKYKQSRTKVRVALPKRKPNVFKAAFCLPPKLRALIDQADPSSRPKWDPEGTVIQNYKSFGVLSNPNLLNVRSRTSHIIESDSLQVPPSPDEADATELHANDDGSDLEEDG